MTYYRLPLPAGLAPDEQTFIRDQLEPYLMDVHALLRLPIDYDGFQGECRGNLAAAEILLAIVSGVSFTLHDSSEIDSDAVAGRLFKAVLQRYPWSQESHAIGALPKDDACESLWRLFRNPLSHSLGAMGPVRSSRFNKAGWGIVIEKGSIPETSIEADERAATRPTGTGWEKPTLRKEGGQLVLWVRSFHWGVRRMILDVAQAHVAKKGIISFATGLQSIEGRTT